MTATIIRNSIYDDIEYTKSNNVIYRWNEQPVLKGTYKNIHAGEVKVYKLSKEEMKEYLKKFDKK